MASIEEKVETYYKKRFDDLNIRYYGKTEKINTLISETLKSANSKSGNLGKLFPDIQLLLEDSHSRCIPVMIEAKGTKGRLEKLTKDGELELITYYKKDSKENAKKVYKAGDRDYSVIQNYAVNGALHYGMAILNENLYNEVIIIGLNGTRLDKDGKVIDVEHKAYYVSAKNSYIPKHIKELDDNLLLLVDRNIDKLFKILDSLNLTIEEENAKKEKIESDLEKAVKSIQQSLYDDKELKTLLSTNEKLYLFCGLIMAGLKTKNVADLDMGDFKSNDDPIENDGSIILRRIKLFLKKKNASEDKIESIMHLLTPVFKSKTLYKPQNDESIIKVLFKQVKCDIIPKLESNISLDFTGKILNSLNDWVSIENDIANDVVLTPREVTTLMVKLARTNKDSFVWDSAMGSAGLLVSAMDIMIKDAKSRITDSVELDAKIKSIKENQLLGIEILESVYLLAVLNMILMGDGSSNIHCGNSLTDNIGENFPATVFLLNPPYSAPGKGFIFVEQALSKMTKGWACILIQESAGSGQGGEFTKNILKNNRLHASIHMPERLFTGKASVQTAIYIFEVNKPHEKDDIVTFIDFSNDGFTRQNRKKSTQEVNLKKSDNPDERYAEIEAIVLGKKSKTSYYTKENGLLIEDTISLDGNDWTFKQHKKIDTMPTEDDFKRTVTSYLSWKISSVLKG